MWLFFDKFSVASVAVEYVEVPEEYRYVLTDCLWEQEKAMPQLDLDLKSAVLSVSSFVVAVRSFSGVFPNQSRGFLFLQ